MEVSDPKVEGNWQMVQEENVAKDSYKAKLMGDSSDPMLKEEVWAV